MKLADIGGRLSLVEGSELVDVERASSGRFAPDPQAVLPRWAEFTAWAAGRGAAGPLPPTATGAGAPVPRPPQAFGIGLNYADHADEANMQPPDQPLVFAKFASCIAGQSDPLEIRGDRVDWEVELVVVIGERCRDVADSDAWGRVAGLTIGQDISDRTLQFAGGGSAQFSLGKSLPGFGPIGPWLVTPDELADPDDLEISCLLNGEEVQRSRTKNLIFGVPRLVAYLSSQLTLLPGDLIFTGTPSGVGLTMDPPRFLAPGDQLVSRIEGLGQLVTDVVGPG